MPQIPEILIDDNYLEEILTVVGFPLIELKDLEVSDKSKIINLFIKPCVREYYKWFPKKTTSEYAISSTFSIDFPNENVYGVTGTRLNTYANTTPVTTNPFFNNLFVRSISGSGKYGYDYGEMGAILYEQSEMQSFIDSQKAFVVHVDKDERKVWGYSNITGRVIIDWASWDSDFSKIPFVRLNDVLDLCKATVLEFYGNLRGQQDSNLSNQFNFDLMLERAQTLRDRVMEDWKSHTKVVIQAN